MNMDGFLKEMIDLTLRRNRNDKLAAQNQYRREISY